MNLSNLEASARPAHPPGVPKWVNWAGWIITVLVVAAFGMSGGMKLKGGPDGAKMMEHIGYAENMVIPLAVFEITCVVLYLVPVTSILAAILLTGYLGGAIASHVRVGDSFLPQMIIGVLVWLGVFFRDYRLRQLIPFRTGKGTGMGTRI